MPANDWGDVAVDSQPKTNDWGDVPVAVSSTPKAPDTSGVQKMAEQNVSASNDNSADGSKPKSPDEHLSTALGQPIHPLLNPDDQTPINASLRKPYTQSLQNGSSVNFSDFMQSTVLPGLAQFIAGGMQRTMHPIDALADLGNKERQFIKVLPANIAADISPESRQYLTDEGDLSPPAQVARPGMPTGPEMESAALRGEQETLGAASSALFWPISTLISPIAEPLISSTRGKPQKPGEPLSYQQNNPELLGAAMDVFGFGGAAHIGTELNAARIAKTQFPSGSGPFDPAIRDAVAKRTGQQPADVTPQDINQTIEQGTNHKAPAGEDFKSVSAVSNIPETALHTVYNETGVKPDQVLDDSRRNSQVASDVAAGKIPEQYEHLVAPKTAIPEEGAASKLQVSYDDATRSYRVLDKDGDHAQGGFDSRQEAQHYIEDEQFKADERKAIEEEPALGDAGQKSEAKQDVFTPENAENTLSHKPVDENIYSGADSKINSMTQGEQDLRLKMLNQKAEAGIITPKEMGEREAISAARPKSIAPSESGKPTSLRTFLSNNGAKFNEANELISIKRGTEKLSGEGALDYAHEISKEQGYLPKDEVDQPSRPVTELQNALTEKNGGRNVWRDADADRVSKARETAQERKNLDPDKIMHEAHNAGIDTTPVKDESVKEQSKRLLKELKKFYESESGSGPTFRKAIGDTIVKAEKFIGDSIAGDFFKKLGDAYTHTFQPELVGPLAKRADAYLAKFKAKGQEAENAFYRLSAKSKQAFDKMSSDERMQWLYDHETSRWNEEEDPDHARFQAMFDGMHDAESKIIGADTAYKENYLPHQWEDSEGVKKFFNSDAMVKKYGKDWFTKASEFKLIQEGVRAGFKLKTDNPESMLVARQLASDNMLRTMDLLKDMESNGIATRVSNFSIDKHIAKTQAAIDDLHEKYKKEFDKANEPNQARAENIPPAESKKMRMAEQRMAELKTRLNGLNDEKSNIKLTPDQTSALKNGLRITGPDSHAWNIHPEAVSIWKNAMEMKGLYEREGLVGDAYRLYSQVKNIYMSAKLSLSLFHPAHEAAINVASVIAAPIDHLIQGGKFSDLAFKDAIDLIPTGSGRAIDAYNAAPEERTPEQKADVQRMMEGGFVPTMSERDAIHFKDNFDKAIAKVGTNNLRLIGTALQLPGKVFEPLFNKWIPRLRSEMYFNLTDKALARDPSLSANAGKRMEVFREISKNIDRTYGQMNQDTLFWNKTVKDSFNGAYISGGWKLAQIYNARGLLQPLNMAYKFAKTGEFSKADITYNMIHAYAYTGTTLLMGAAINKMLGNPIGKTVQESKDIKDFVWSTVEDCVFPKTGDKNPDGTPIRLSQPAFAKEYFMLARDVNTDGLLAGTGKFIYHGTIIPGIAETLSNRDFVGRKEISDPTDLNQWKNAGWDSISPITLSTYERAEEKGTEKGKIAGLLGFPIAGSYVDQTPFEQKVLATYSEQNPAKGDAYSAKLRTDLKAAKTAEDKEDIKNKMKKEGMTSKQIGEAEKPFTKKFVETAWEKLSPQDQKHLLESASTEEKKKFKMK